MSFKPNNSQSTCSLIEAEVDLETKLSSGVTPAGADRTFFCGRNSLKLQRNACLSHHFISVAHHELTTPRQLLARSSSPIITGTWYSNCCTRCHYMIINLIPICQSPEASLLMTSNIMLHTL